jgi:hypothetical protein
MSWGFDDINCGGRLQVGTGIVPAIKEGDEKINGSMHCEGPAVFGGPTEFDDNVATLMVGRTKNDDKDCVPADRSLYVKGNTFIEGDGGTSNALNVSGDTNVTGNSHVTGNITTGGDLTVGGFASWSGSIVATTKLFDIPHPNKEGHRLAHACLEGPEHSVYFRGKVRNRTTIQLPKYWEGLVDYTTITVNLTPIGAHQNVIVKRVDESKIYLQAQGGMPINCYFHVYGTRQDVGRLEVEYEGESFKDSPNNS